jgi:alanine-glyoxylate transaminase/serine-glyoxylate transaminase/serine-pyruvate transaminase
MTHRAGRHFLQIPGPTNVPDRVLRAIDRPTIDHRGPDFQKIGFAVLEGMKRVFQTQQPVIIYAGSGTGAWEAALVNTLNPGDKVLMSETGHFSTLWSKLAKKVGLEVEVLPGDWRRGADHDSIERRLREDTGYAIKAVCIVHNETSTGVTTRVPLTRKAIDNAKHPALLMVDTISSLASIDYKHDEWGVDVTVGGSQKGLMLPPGLGFNAISEKALAAHKQSKMPRSYWDWSEILASNANGYWPSTPATNLLYGLEVAIEMLEEEGYANVFARHDRHAEATRRAVRAWGLEILCAIPEEYSSALTAVMMPPGHDADRFRALTLEHFDMSLGTGLSKLASKVFRIGHLGDFNDLTLAGTLSGVEMGLAVAGVPHKKGGVDAAIEYLAAEAGKRVGVKRAA